MNDQWKECDSVYGGHRCIRRAGHIGLHKSGWLEWGSRDV